MNPAGQNGCAGASACSVPTPTQPGGDLREKERQEDHCPGTGPVSLPWWNLEAAIPFPQQMDHSLLGWGTPKTPILSCALG